MMAALAVAGLWHLGSVAAACWAELGHHVVAWDPDPAMRQSVAKATGPVAEPGLDEALRTAVEQGRLRVVDSIARAVADAVVIHVAFDTKTDESGNIADPRLDAVVEAVARGAPDGALLLVSSQVPAGTCQRWKRRLAQEARNLSLAYYPENLRLGDAMRRFRHPDGPVVGADEPSTRERATALLAPLAPAILVTDLITAEFVKHARNAYLAMCIAFANELSWIVRAGGGDVADVVAGLRADFRVSPAAPLRPGPAFSGATLKRDVRALQQLASRAGRPELFATILAVNDRHARVAVQWIVEELGDDLRGRTLAILGLTYKSGTSTLRDSLSVRIVSELLERGAACRGFDPLAEPTELGPGFSRSHAIEECVDGVDAVAVLTDLPELAELDWAKLKPRRRVLVDAIGIVNAAAAAEAGWTMRSVWH